MLFTKLANMKPLGRIILAFPLIFAVYALVSLAWNFPGGVEFNGRIYPSIAEARQAAVGLPAAVNAAQAKVADDLPFYCGQRLSIRALILGFYGPYDPMVCYTSEAESDQLYTENRALEARYKPFAEKVLPTMACASLLIVLATLFRRFRKRKR